MLWMGSAHRLGVDLGAVVRLRAIFRGGQHFATPKKWLLDVHFNLNEVHDRECIGRDIGCGSCEEDEMLWSGFGGRLGVDLGGLVRSAEEREISRISNIADCSANSGPRRARSYAQSTHMSAVGPGVSIGCFGWGRHIV